MFSTDDDNIRLKKAPYNLEAEQALLGSLMFRNEALDQVIDFLEAHHFYDPLHGQIYDAIAKLVLLGKRATPITLKPFFEAAEGIDSKLSAVGYLGKLATGAASILNASIRDYGRTIHDLAVRRSLIVIGEDMVALACDSPIDFSPKEQIEAIEARLFQLVERNERGGTVTLADAIDKALKSMIAALHNTRTGIPTELADLDRLLFGGGLNPSDLVILAGRPAHGKSALAMNIAVAVAKRGTPVGFFSQEMSAQQLAMRVLGEWAEMSASSFYENKTRDPMEVRSLSGKLTDVAGRVSRLPIITDETGALSIARLATRARRMRRKDKVGLIVIDYVQLMHSDARSENRVQDITRITTGLKALAKELEVPILALSQLNRGVENRPDRRPQLADLRESGSLEQDADIVMFIHREEVYVRREQPDPGDVKASQEWSMKLQGVAGKAELIIAKQRNGPTGMVNLAFNAKLTRFSSLEVRRG